MSDATVLLPAELLADIFDMCVPPGEDGVNGLSDTTTADEEVERLAKQYLLDLSQVCSRWHSIVMDTPLLWRIIVVDTTLWLDVDVDIPILIQLVQNSLDRGKSCPLVLQVAVDDDESYSFEVLRLLSQHAPRWYKVHFWSEFQSMRSIASAKGNLGLLTELKLSQIDEWGEFDVFELAPSLTNLSITSWGTFVLSIPWNQIKHLRYHNYEANDIVNTLSILRNDLPRRAQCKLFMSAIHMDSEIDLPPIESDMYGLWLTIKVTAETTASALLGAILACLTLHGVKQLGLEGKTSSNSPLSWSQSQFLAFASRSSLHTSLRHLEICRTTITDEELLDCLTILPLLEELLVDDNPRAPHTVITDAFLRRLILTPSPSSLVPRLNFLCLTSLLNFSDSVLWDVIASRGVPAKPDAFVFEMKIYWLSGRSRELSADLISRSLELEENGDLNFTYKPDPEEAALAEADEES
ncbi:F-box domain-containing protein [Favolaschia claudopus]|uniref:F-box domain-containing protein n=1 Tax=Favolaschia claudopus TaxID=2862362 RepID=A0AAW0E2A9_9AGAR